MKFDITNIDKVKLLQALYDYANPAECGKSEYLSRKSNGENPSELTNYDCNLALKNFNEDKYTPGLFHIFDYYNGKPLKVDFCRLQTGRVIVSSASYDKRNGNYRFLSAMLNNFSTEDIIILDKALHTDIKNDNDKYFKAILETTVRVRSEFGYYWKIQSLP